MNTKLQTKAIKNELKALKKALAADEAATVKAYKQVDREILAKKRERDRLINQGDLRAANFRKRIAILEGRL